MYCPKCGIYYADGFTYCDKCGSKLQGESGNASEETVSRKNFKQMAITTTVFSLLILIVSIIALFMCDTVTVSGSTYISITAVFWLFLGIVSAIIAITTIVKSR
ncbi:MAG: zinc-ribbon domain-containing protein [Candidatus Methanomethylophilaceae archaeon]|jgi:uncharacterized membrane protein YvbJ